MFGSERGDNAVSFPAGCSGFCGKQTPKHTCSHILRNMKKQKVRFSPTKRLFPSLLEYRAYFADSYLDKDSISFNKVLGLKGMSIN